MFQAKFLRLAMETPWYVINLALHADLKISFVKEVAKNRDTKFFHELQHNPNILVRNLSDLNNLTLRFTIALGAEIYCNMRLFGIPA